MWLETSVALQTYVTLNPDKQKEDSLNLQTKPLLDISELQLCFQVPQNITVTYYSNLKHKTTSVDD